MTDFVGTVEQMPPWPKRQPNRVLRDADDTCWSIYWFEDGQRWALLLYDNGEVMWSWDRPATGDYHVVSLTEVARKAGFAGGVATLAAALEVAQPDQRHELTADALWQAWEAAADD